VYRYAADTSAASAALTQVSRRLSACARDACDGAAGQDAGSQGAASLQALRQAVAEALQTATGVQSIASTLGDAAAWYAAQR
jgi:hypothetical protein